MKMGIKGRFAQMHLAAAMVAAFKDMYPTLGIKITDALLEEVNF